MAGKGVDLEGLTLPELEALADNVAVAIRDKREARRHELHEEMKKLAEREGLTLAEVMKAGRVRRTRKKATPKYRNPADESQTWSGRGRTPKWVQEALDAGKTLEDLAIDAGGGVVI